MAFAVACPSRSQSPGPRRASDGGHVEIAADIASNVGDMGRFSVRDEAAHWAGEIVDAARRIRHRRLTVVLTWAASSAWSMGRLEEAKRYGEEAVSLADNPDFEPFVWAFIDLAMVASYEGDTDRAIALWVLIGEIKSNVHVTINPRSSEVATEVARLCPRY